MAHFLSGVAMSNLRKCVGPCGELMPETAFERTGPKSVRKECKKCYGAKKAARAKEKSSKIDRDTVPKPTCSECGKASPEVDFKWRDDVAKGGWRNQCNDCFNAKGYSQKSRSKRRAEDERAFLAQSAKHAAKFRKNNPDKIVAQRNKERMEPERKIKAIIRDATSREVHFEFDDLDAMKSKLTDGCAYCGFAPVLGTDALNGLDRVDNSKGYINDNVVPSCGVCQHIKGPQDIDEFIDNIRRITKYGNIDIDNIAGGSSGARALGGHADLRAASKEKTCFLSIDQKIDLWSSPCYLCGRSPALGIDRIDSSGDYTQENSRPCCSDCNYMKSDHPLETFKHHAALIAKHTATWVLRDVVDLPLKVCGGKCREPVIATDQDTGNRLVFPSMNTAAKCVRKDAAALFYAISTKKTCANLAWERASGPKEYRCQNIDKVNTESLFRTAFRARNVTK